MGVFFIFSHTMNIKVLFLFVLFSFAFAQTRVAKRTIDPFSPVTPPLVILIDVPLSSGDDSITVEDSTEGSGILGGERDLRLTAEFGEVNLVLTTSVANNRWSVSTPNGASGFALMQYDGVDDSIVLRENGLGGVNFRDDSADAFRMLIQSDLETDYTISIYSGSGTQSSRTFSVPGDDVTNEFFIEFSEFTGNANFENIGAVEVLIEAFDNVDTFVEEFITSGPVSSPTPTRSPGTSASPTPSPEGDNFTWYTFDDDDNGRSPCGDETPRRTYFVNDDNIIYYYFYGFEPEYVEGSSSGASLIQISSGLIITTIAFFFM